MKDKFDYIQNQNLCGINIGDKVKVIRKAANFENGWDNEWTPSMDAAVGNEYKVIFNNGALGFSLDFDSDMDFPYFVLSKVIEKPEQPNPNFEGYDEEFMDATLRDSIKLLRDTLDYAKLNSQTPKPASGYTATLTFDLTTVDGAEAWHVHKQAYELHSFAFEVLYNLSKNFEREVQAQADRIMMENTTAADDGELAVDILRRLINELADNYNLNVN